jgi:hypothetical protein
LLPEHGGIGDRGFAGMPIPDSDRLYVAGYDGFYALRKD